MSSGNNNTPSLGLNIISFLIPILGLIFFQTYVGSAPAKAAAIRKFTIAGFVVWVIAGIAISQFV